MKDFTNNRAINTHEHHEMPVHDANDGSNNNTQSKHENEKGKQHNQKKETKEMYRKIKDSITPTLTVFAVSTALVLGLALNVKNSKTNIFDANNFAKDFFSDNLRADKIDYDKRDRAWDVKRTNWNNPSKVDNDKEARIKLDDINFVKRDGDDANDFYKAEKDRFQNDKLYDAKQSANKVDKLFYNAKTNQRNLDKWDNDSDRDRFIENEQKA